MSLAISGEMAYLVILPQVSINICEQLEHMANLGSYQDFFGGPDPILGA